MLRLYDINTLQCFTTTGAETHDDCITFARFSANSEYFVTASEDGDIRVWDTVSGECVRSIVGAHGKWPVNCVQISKNGNFILSAGSDSLGKLWDLGTGTFSALTVGKLIHEFEGAVQQVSISFVIAELSIANDAEL